MILNWRLFENKYQDFLDEIERSKKIHQNAIENYKEDILECLYEVLDDYTYKAEIEQNQDYKYHCITNIETTFDKLDILISDLKISNERLKNLIGKNLKILRLNVYDDIIEGGFWMSENPLINIENFDIENFYASRSSDMDIFNKINRRNKNKKDFEVTLEVYI